MSPTRDYWFAAKRYGWGWGLPIRWQGWAVMAVYTALVGVVVVRFPPNGHPIRFAMLIILLSLALVAICWLKGEPPRWRWGKD